jgi:hypothetical protein
MAYKVTFLSTVPNSSVSHWGQTHLGNAANRKMQELLVQYGDSVISWFNKKGENSILTEIVFTDESVYNTIYQQISETYPGYDVAKYEYLTENNITLTVTKEYID